MNNNKSQKHKNPLLRLNKVSLCIHSDTKHIILNQINLEIAPNSIVGLLGNSGSGKSMTAQTILGISPASYPNVTGAIYWENQKINLRDKSSQKELSKFRGNYISFIPQEPSTAFNPVILCKNQIFETIRQHQPKLSHNSVTLKAHEVLKLVHLDPQKHLHRYPHQLSGGQLQRMAIALAIVNNPKLIIADEPTTALDSYTQKEIIDLLLKLKNQLQFSILFISHDINLTRKICDFIHIIDHGKIIDTGTIEHIETKTSNLISKRLLHSLPPNITPKTILNPQQILKVRNISLSYKPSLQILQKINLDLNKQEILGLIGVTGSGKTSLGKVISGLINSDQGKIVLFDQILAPSLKQRKKHNIKAIQYIFQDHFNSLNPSYSIGKTLLEAINSHKNLPIDSINTYTDLMLQVELDPQALFNQFPFELSGGQRQRIAIARALASEPKILICDEIISSLDNFTKNQILNLLDQFRKKNKISILFITHDLKIATKICDRIAVMHKGKIVEINASQKINKEANHPITKKLINAII